MIRLKMKIRFFIALFLFFTQFFPTAGTQENNVIIETKYGKVEGDVIKVNADFSAAVFKGIPYGIAKLFEKPEPVKVWNGTKLRKKWGPMCPQLSSVFLVPMNEDEKYYSEDCLLLNVFTVYPNKKEKLLPVMVWVHGGGLQIGASKEYGQDGIVEWMVSKGVVFVTLNYRLGPWGFFSTGTADAPGNYGFWDQTLALKWVKENIDRFGGDPKKITVFGESAGAISTSVLFLSPHSRDLFQQAILMSGSSLCPGFNADGSVEELSDRFAVGIGCGSFKKGNAKQVMECMKSKSTAELLEQLKIVKPPKFFATVIDGDFLPQSIETLQHATPSKPIIIGNTAEEAASFVTPATGLPDPGNVNDPKEFDLNRFHNEVKPKLSGYEHADIVERLALHHYVDSVGDRNNNSLLLDGYVKLYTDWFFNIPAYNEALYKHKRGSPVWRYLFNYYDQAIYPIDYKFMKGAQHFLDVAYLFKFENIYHKSPWEGNDLKIANIMTTMWTNFAIYGHPNPDNSILHKEFSWDPIDDQHPDRYLHIGLQTQQHQSNYFRPGVSFWLQILPDLMKYLKGIQDSNIDAVTSGKSEL